jgi:hypothetical protein
VSFSRTYAKRLKLPAVAASAERLSVEAAAAGRRERRRTRTRTTTKLKLLSIPVAAIAGGVSDRSTERWLAEGCLTPYERPERVRVLVDAHGLEGCWHARDAPGCRNSAPNREAERLFVGHDRVVRLGIEHPRKSAILLARPPCATNRRARSDRS